MPENDTKQEEEQSTSPQLRSKQAEPGVSRENRISDEGLLRLEKQLRAGSNISVQVLEQWVKRYGNAARDLIIKYGQNRDKK